MRTTLLGALCIAVLCVIFSLGLWPFHSPHNQVTWLRKLNGVELGKYGTVLSAGELSRSKDDKGHSIEIWVQPNRRMGATILSLYRPEDRVQFLLNQSLTDLELQVETPSASRRHFYASEALASSLHEKKPVFVTVTSGPAGTTVYLDGVLTMKAPRFLIPEEAFAGRLIIGDSPEQPNSFRGQIRGLAVYAAELSAAQVFHHYEMWTENGAPEIAPDERNTALYLFNEGMGNVIHNRAAFDSNLQIPNTYAVINKIALEPFWREFDLSPSYWSGNLKNVVGFIPVGFCFYAFIVSLRPMRHAVLLTVFLGFLVSLTIEILQIFLPTRDSGTTDLITNTFGTYLGVLCYLKICPIMMTRLPILGWILATERPESHSKRLVNYSPSQRPM